MKKNFLFLVLAVAMSSVQCTHNYYYGTVYTTPDHQGRPVEYSGGYSGNQGYGGNSGSGSTSGSGTSGSTTGSSPHADPPGRPTGTGSSPAVDPPGRPTGSGTTTGGTPDHNPGNGSGNPTNTTTLPQQINTRHLFRTWMHSREEDEGQVQVYRPSTYAFPPSRGREGLTFEAGGKVIQHGIAATDGTENNTGTWNLRNRTLSISSIKDQRPYQLEIVSLDDNVLKVKRR